MNYVLFRTSDTAPIQTLSASFGDVVLHASNLGPDVLIQEVSDDFRIEDWAVSAGSLIVRPTPPAPPAMASGVDALWNGLPPGAVVTAISGISGQVGGSDVADAQGALLLALPAGPWRLEVSETWPAVAASFEVEVAP